MRIPNQSKITGVLWNGLAFAVGMVVMVPLVSWVWAKINPKTTNTTVAS